MGGGIPTPPLEEHHKSSSPRKSSASSKALKLAHRNSKRSNTHSTVHAHHEQSSNSLSDGRHKRVWKACERCRMKKTKCDGEFPCKRCKDDGLVCTAGVRKKTEYKQLPRGYAEVLENTQFALIATVHKLYAMVRNGQKWELGEPELNDRGQPVVHNIASMLGCIRPNSDIDLPVHSVFPEDEAGMLELARQLDEQQRDMEIVRGPETSHGDNESSNGRTDRASSSDLDHSDFERDLRNYRQAAFNNNPLTLSPQSFSSYNDFDSVPEADPATAASVFSTPPPTAAAYPAWTTMRRSATTMDITPQFLQQAGLSNVDMLNQGLLESDFGTLKPHIMNCPNPEVMLGMGDPMIYSGYDGEPMRL